MAESDAPLEPTEKYAALEFALQVQANQAIAHTQKLVDEQFDELEQALAKAIRESEIDHPRAAIRRARMFLLFRKVKTLTDRYYLRIEEIRDRELKALAKWRIRQTRLNLKDTFRNPPT